VEAAPDDFVNSMSDLFQKEIPKAHISAVFDTMEKADWHVYQVLTKRSSLLQKFINDRYHTRKAPAHMWFGVSVENEQATSRIGHLQKANAGVRFLSVEPLIAPVGRLDLRGIDWVIVGGESGPGARPMNPAWAIDVRNQCVAARVAFFFKQWADAHLKPAGVCSKAGNGTSFRRWAAHSASLNCGQAHDRTSLPV
jgi:protein gp37